ncbi:hypothetical protein DYBT9623_02405 [Dyadobacter sp. CECT 9623]|jgi:hypothetical protein|uniref:Uncharacterized protein n=1 Tax=Dyadobacter linearis TaxID=2823330 RepID=A0ABN7R8B2_9BACT|nr:hypothetical protein [Dyadobacter sp. CECT 9623]CAG5069669.1 hypothetical protein DYBT9623_02405 [Dyadobacter sp. CECT 9623]
MEAQTIDSQILKYLPMLGEDEKQSLLGVIKSFLSLKKDSKSTETAFTLDYNRELDEALARINEGNFMTQEEVEKQSAEW